MRRWHVSPADLLTRHHNITVELAAALRERGDLNQQIIRIRAARWRDTDHLNVTERRETVREATGDLDGEVAKLTGEIDAYAAELADINVWLRYSDADT